MREKRLGKVFRSAAEWRAIVARYERSGLTQAAFCTQEGLALYIFKKHYRSHKEAALRLGQFLEVVPSVPGAAGRGRRDGQPHVGGMAAAGGQTQPAPGDSPAGVNPGRAIRSGSAGCRLRQ